MTIFINNLSLKHKQIFILLLDIILLPLSLWIAFAIQFNQWWPQELQTYWWMLLISPGLALPLFVRWGLYRAVLNYISTQAFVSIFKSISLHTLLFAAVSIMIGTQGLSITLYVVYWLVTLSLVGGSRLLLRALLQWSRRDHLHRTSVIIYGAGEAGAELAEALQAGLEFKLFAFIDDKQHLHGKEIRGTTIFPTQKLGSLIKKYKVKQILLAIPSASMVRRREIIKYLEEFPVHIRSVPALMDIVSGRSHIAELHQIGIEDILGRRPIPPNRYLLTKCIKNKSIMVTGAGGSIGSELCRQIIKLGPTQLILYEICEFALYQIEKEISDYCAASSNGLTKIKIIPVLGSVTNEARMKLVLETFAVNTLYHAAAYKHVPLVEYNPLEGVINNVFGTWYTAQAAIDASVDTFILISTDKAVRPANVMGATKRFSELVIQSLAQAHDSTNFSIVRFGNVLDSSGSVVPLFRQQIENGGPITITHQNMTRFFMTIPEAAELVIQAGSMGGRGDVFILDMGKQIKIKDLARQMVSLSGLTLRDEDNPDGDIDIKITQLRPGEKLHEELLIGGKTSGTKHPSIMRVHETNIPWQRLQSMLTLLNSACKNNDDVKVRSILIDCVDGYSPQCDIEDVVWRAGDSALHTPLRDSQKTRTNDEEHIHVKADKNLLLENSR